jgi:hypothetical protein
MPVEFMDAWINQGPSVHFIIRPLFHPEQFLTAGLQSYAKKKDSLFDTLRWIPIPKPQMNRMA